MFRKISSFSIVFTSKFLLSLSFFGLWTGLFFQAFAMDNNIFSEDLSGEHKHKLEIIRTDHYWYTKPFRSEESVDLVQEPLCIDKCILNSGKILMYGGTIIGKDNRQQILNITNTHWKIHGQLTMQFDNTTYTGTGTLISPWHVLTAGHLLYDPEKEIWAKNIQFHAARNGEKLLYGSIPCVKKAVFAPWKYGAETSDMGIIELAQDIGSKIGWNGLLWGDDFFLSHLDPINVSGYPGDKSQGTMWTDLDEINDITNEQFTYKLSTFEGQSGANPWVIIEEPKGFYSIGVHTYGVMDRDVGIFNIATRLTKGKLEGLENLINNLF